MAYTYIEGNQNHTSGPNGAITRIVIHATVSPCVVGDARNVAGYFQSPNAGGLAHYVVDPTEIIQCCKEDTACWHAPPNHGSIGIELCDPQTGPVSRWDDTEHKKMLALARNLVHDVASRHQVPLIFVDAAGLKAGKHGVTTHNEVSLAFGQSSHTDPGPGFGPYMNALLAGAPVTPAKPPYVAPVNDSPSKHAWPLADDAVIHVNNKHVAVDTVARYLKQPVDPNHVYTSFMATAVAHWQDRHKLSTSPAGILNKDTWEAMK
jgi:hypothetical protein